METQHGHLPLDSAQWLAALSTETGIKENHSHYWGNDPSTLITSAKPQTVSIGNGSHLYQKTLLPAFEAAEEEVLFVTCFWAHSVSLFYLWQSLVHLSDKALARNDGSRIRVRLCFSSRSILQKMFHTSSPDGYIYPPSEWVSKLGLPHPKQLLGLDLKIKSMFFRPFSVMHPKFMIVDRHMGFMPSCNLSWESWLECCLALNGPIVSKLVEFWAHFWGRNDLPPLVLPQRAPSLPSRTNTTSDPVHRTSSDLPLINPLSSSNTAILLPSPHHSTAFLSFPISFLPVPSPPPTPLNTLLLYLFSTATHSIKLLTPNLTSPPVIAALNAALSRGVDVFIVTNRRMMMLEQLLTAGTVTELCVWKMAQRYRSLLASTYHTKQPLSRNDSARILEEGRTGSNIGKLQISYFRPLRLADADAEPLKSHVKCTIIDEEVIVLGSGNMDRASWYTSQELGIALRGRELVAEIWGSLEGALEGRLERYLG